MRDETEKAADERDDSERTVDPALRERADSSDRNLVHPADGVPTGPDSTQRRRRFLKVGIGSLGAAAAAVTVGPAIVYVAHPLLHETTSGGAEFIIVGHRDRFPPDKPVKVDLFADVEDAWNRLEQVKIGSVWVINRNGKLIAFTTVCPHLGCAIDWAGDSNAFKCPCHRSAFSLEGEVEKGPSPRAMDRLELKTQKDGIFAVRYQRFKQGVSRKEPL